MFKMDIKFFTTLYYLRSVVFRLYTLYLNSHQDEIKCPNPNCSTQLFGIEVGCFNFNAANTPNIKNSNLSYSHLNLPLVAKLISAMLVPTPVLEGRNTTNGEVRNKPNKRPKIVRNKTNGEVRNKTNKRYRKVRNKTNKRSKKVRNKTNKRSKIVRNKTNKRSKIVRNKTNGKVRNKTNKRSRKVRNKTNTL